MISLDEARARVARGAAHLDETWPGWWAQIDLGTLSLASCSRCVVGQLAGDFVPRLVGLRDNGHDGETPDLVTHGFDLQQHEIVTDHRKDSYLPLQDAWIDAIADRRRKAVIAE